MKGGCIKIAGLYRQGFTWIAAFKDLRIQFNRQKTQTTFQSFIIYIYESASTRCTLKFCRLKLKSCKIQHVNNIFQASDTLKATRVPPVSRRSRCECEYSRRDRDLLLAVNHHQCRPDRLSPQVTAVTWGKLLHVGVLSETDRGPRWSCTCWRCSVAIKVKAHGG